MGQAVPPLSFNHLTNMIPCSTCRFCFSNAVKRAHGHASNNSVHARCPISMAAGQMMIPHPARHARQAEAHVWKDQPGDASSLCTLGAGRGPHVNRHMPVFWLEAPPVALATPL